MLQFKLTIVDLATIAVYAVVVLAVGFVASRRTKTTEDYFLAGRSLTWPLIGLSLFASNISSSTLVGLAGDAYASGIAVYNYEWFAVVVLVFFLIFFLPLYLRTRIYTMPEFLERRFDARSRFYVSSVTVVGNVLLETAGALYAGALVVQLVYPQIPLWQSAAVLAVLSGLYTAAGGLKAVVYTDAIQAVLLIAGATAVSALAYMKVGSWSAVTEAFSERELSLIQPLDHPTLPWLGLVTGLPLLGVYYWCNNQYIVQRALGARDLDQGRYGALLAGFLKIPVLFIMVLPGTFARLLYPDLERADMVFPTLVFDLLPPGFRGLVLVALVAAIMSSIDSTLNSVSTLVTMDFVKKFRPNLENWKLVMTGRIATIVVMILGAVWAPQIARFPSLWQYLQGVLAYITPPVVACFLMGIFWRRANGTGAFAALMVGMIAALLLVFAGAPLHFLYVAAILFALSVLTIVIVSLLTAPQISAEVDQMVWTKALLAESILPQQPTRWYRNHITISILLLAATAAVVIPFA
ncbi:MAG TPA: sodium:solute symporter [Rhodothermia bacterium]